VPLLEVNDLSTHFFTRDGVVRAVDGVSFAIEKGKTLGIVGESGCGKSVTALSIMGLIPIPPAKIVSGEVLFEGRDLTKLSEHRLEDVRGREIAMIFQDPMTALNPVFTVGSQLVETIRLHRAVSAGEAREIALDALRDVQIARPERRLDDYPHQLSGGLRQRIVIAMAVACQPRLLIADEPTTALDVTTQAQILDLIYRLTEERGTAVMLITHDLGVVAGFCDTVQEMYAGRIVERGLAEDVFYRPMHPYSAGLLGCICRLDRERSQQLTQIRGAPPSLASLPSGCTFNPRCAFARDRCRVERPALREIEQGHLAACHFAGELDLPGAHAARGDGVPGAPS